MYLMRWSYDDLKRCPDDYIDLIPGVVAELRGATPAPDEDD